VRQNKKNWIRKEIEVLQSRLDEFNVHRKVKEVTRMFKKKNV